MLNKKIFIAGTDTDVGKTFISQALLLLAQSKDMSCYGLKPIAAGCEETEQGLRNDDALKLMNASTVKLSYDQVNPIALEHAVAPHVAAKLAGRNINLQRVVGFCRGAMMTRADFILIEGAGGWRVPLNNREMMSQIPKALSVPVVLVVGIKLGCINHALLTVESIQREGVHLAGWVANYIDPNMSNSSESIETLKVMINAPLMGVVPFLGSRDPQQAVEHLQFV